MKTKTKIKIAKKTNTKRMKTPKLGCFAPLSQVPRSCLFSLPPSIFVFSPSYLLLILLGPQQDLAWTPFSDYDPHELSLNDELFVKS